MNFPLPLNALSLRGDSFYQLVEQFCGAEVVELLKLQLFDSSLGLIEVDDIFLILQFESDKTSVVKEVLGIPGKDQQGNYSFFVMPGIRLKVQKLIRSLRSLLAPVAVSSSSIATPLTLSTDLVQRYPFLVNLVSFLESNSLTGFSSDFISNLFSNVSRVSSSFRYEQSVKDFAVCLYILGGKTAYELLRLNIPGSLPNHTSLQSILATSKHQFVEGEFQYERLEKFVAPLGCKYAFCGEDATTVISKVTYDSLSNCFVGFVMPLENGFPIPRYYSTDLFGQLDTWYDQVEKSTLLNVHVVQALCPVDRLSPSPFLLAAYGTNSKYTAKDIVNRWIVIFDRCMALNIRVLGFSTDADAKCLKAMRDSMGFFSNERTIIDDHPNNFEIALPEVSQALHFQPKKLR
jgi:hypothetical protein